jgi:hypothetical protein
MATLVNTYVIDACALIASFEMKRGVTNLM